MRPTAEPRWLSRAVVEAVHDQRLQQDGGLPGLRDAAALESALGRPIHRWHYEDACDLADCAASYGFALAKSHPFIDGNKRTAFVAMATFYEYNGGRLVASEGDVVDVMVGVADGTVAESDLATWIRASTPAKRHRRPR